MTESHNKSDRPPAPASPVREQQSDEEKQAQQANDATDSAIPEKKVSAFKSLGWLDRFLAVWIFLSMVIGILLGNFVPNTTEALEKGKFVGVSVPIGESHKDPCDRRPSDSCSNRIAGYDVSHPMQRKVRDSAPHSRRKESVEAARL